MLQIRFSPLHAPTLVSSAAKPLGFSYHGPEPILPNLRVDQVPHVAPAEAVLQLASAVQATLAS